MLKKFIGESFYNPVLHILPIFVFLFAGDYLDLKTGWELSVVVAGLLMVYTRILYRQLFYWLLASVGIFVLIASISTIITLFVRHSLLSPVMNALVTTTGLGLMLLLKTPVERFVFNKAAGRTLSMLNNMHEFERLLRILVVMLSIYLISFVAIEIWAEYPQFGTHFVRQSFLILFIFVTLYEFIRVRIVRSELMKEEWWPIVNDYGKQIGTIQQHISLADPKKYKHPVVRLIVLDGNRILMHENSCKAELSPNCWDCPVTGHIRSGEVPESAMNRLTITTYGVEEVKSVFLMNYTYEADYEFQYVHLYLTGSMPGSVIKNEALNHVKWWTVGQIEDNLESGIFSSQFKIEFEILKRSGLVITPDCQCDCRLKDVVNPPAK